MKNKLPPCFAIKNTGKHPRKEEIKKRFNEMSGRTFLITNIGVGDFYGCNNNGIFDWHHYIELFGSTVVEITEDDFLDMTEPELTELPKVFAFKNNPDSPNHDLLKERFNCLIGKDFDMMCNYYYGRSSEGIYMWFTEKTLPKDVVELTEQQFLDLTERKTQLTKLPHNFYFQYVDEKDREVLKDRFNRGCEFYKHCIDLYYGVKNNVTIQGTDKLDLRDSTEITQADFIRLTEPEKKVEPEIVTEHLPKPELTPITGQIIEISERGILIELTREQIKEFKIFETVTIK